MGTIKMKRHNRNYFILGMISSVSITSFITWANVTNIAGFNIFNPGTIISASQMNQNFDLINQKIDSVGANTYLGTYDASVGIDPSPASADDYYIINTAGTISVTAYSVGDWIVFNGTVWERVGNSSSIISVHGRTGAVVSAEGDYNLNQLTDVDLTVAPVAGKVLKYDGTKWIASDDLSGGGAGSVTATEIAAGAVTDAKINDVAAGKITGTLTGTQIGAGVIMNSHINASAGIDYSKLNIPNTTIPYAKLNIADG